MNTAIEDKIYQLQHEIDFAENKLKTNLKNISAPQVVEYITSNVVTAPKISKSSSPDPMYGLASILNSNKLKSNTWIDKIIFIKSLIKIFT